MPPISTVNKIAKIFNGDKQIVKIFAGDSLFYEKAGESSGIPSYYVQVSSADFDRWGNYIGTEEYIILPEDKTSAYWINNPNVKGVATNGNYLINAENMFRDHGSLYIELDYLDTSNVTSMNLMFQNSQATTLDLSSFDTSNVTSMIRMFQNSQATTLDLSSFDTSNVAVNNMFGMFTWSQATTGYARTQAEADKFNSVSDKPSTLTFVVK